MTDREALREGVASDDARYRALKRKIMALIVDTWDGVRLIDNAAEIAITLVMEEAAKEIELCYGPHHAASLRAYTTPSGKDQ